MPKRKVIEIPAHIAPTMKIIGDKITELRKEVDVNYRNFATSNDINVMTLWRIQNGEDCKLSSLLNILTKLNVTPEEFFKGIK